MKNSIRETPIVLGSLLLVLSACSGSPDEADESPLPNREPTTAAPSVPASGPAPSPGPAQTPLPAPSPVSSPLPAPTPTPIVPVPVPPPVSPTIPDGWPGFLGRPWSVTARTAQDVLDARGLTAVRELVAAFDAELGLRDSPSVDRACPGGGSATATSGTEPRHEERHYAFAGCTMLDGRRLDGVHDLVARIDDEGDSIKRGVEEYFALTGASAASTLAVDGTSSDALSGRRPDACGLIRRERVLRLDLPTMVVDDVAVDALAVEDITNFRPSAPGAGDGAAECGEQLIEYAFSDSARIMEGAAGVRYVANRTGSIVLDAAGAASSSGSDARLRIHAPDADDSLDLGPDFSRDDGATVTIDEHPGRTEFAATWRFVER